MSQQQREFLDAMGIQAWQLRLNPPHGPQIPQPTEANTLLLAEPPTTAEPPLGVQAQPFAQATQLIAPSHPNAVELSASTPSPNGGGPGWGRVKSEALQPFDRPPPNLPPLGRGVHSTASPSLMASAGSLPDWESLQAQVKACTACPLHQTRSQTVFGVGNPQADWLIIGEAPGEQEDLQGEPFVGPAGLLLNEMLRAIGLAREAVYIANILKCRPPRNRDPQPLEVAACEGFLKNQIAHLQPKIILAVGRIAAQNLLKTTTPIGKLRGRRHDYLGVPLVVTYHPAYLLRSPSEKRSAYADLRLARQTYRQL